MASEVLCGALALVGDFLRLPSGSGTEGGAEHQAPAAACGGAQGPTAMEQGMHSSPLSARFPRPELRGYSCAEWESPARVELGREGGELGGTPTCCLCSSHYSFQSTPYDQPSTGIMSTSVLEKLLHRSLVALWQASCLWHLNTLAPWKYRSLHYAIHFELDSKCFHSKSRLASQSTGLSK